MLTTPSSLCLSCRQMYLFTGETLGMAILLILINFVLLFFKVAQQALTVADAAYPVISKVRAQK